MRHWLTPAFTGISAILFWLAVYKQTPEVTQSIERPANVAIAAPIQVLLYGGDRFLAANVESMRTAAANTIVDAKNYRLQAHLVVSQLNPCHEDNYWFGNASLSWGGAEQQGFDLLSNAMHCRFWDEWPAFFYGFNQNFFLHNVDEARDALELAAQRSADNAPAFRTFSTMLAAGEINNAHMALKMLKNERDKAKDSKLREMLDKRVERMKGLLVLRDAQAEYEKRFKKGLTRPQELLESGILKNFPVDPLGIGYEFKEQTFHLKKMKIK